MEQVTDCVDLDPLGTHDTSTNVRKYTSESSLLESGLIGPVEIVPIFDLVLSDLVLDDLVLNQQTRTALMPSSAATFSRSAAW